MCCSTTESVCITLVSTSLGTPVRGQFLIYIRALRATLNKTDRSFNSVSLYKSASYMSFVIPAWLTKHRKPSTPPPPLGPPKPSQRAKLTKVTQITHIEPPIDHSKRMRFYNKEIKEVKVRK